MSKVGSSLFVIALAVLLAFECTSASGKYKADLINTPNFEIVLTQQEKDFLKEHPVIRFGTDDRWEPYAIKKADGTLEGFDVDLIKYINERVGTNIQISTGPWVEIVEQAKNLKLDGLATSAQSKERGLFFNFSNSYITLFPTFVVAGNNNLKINGIDDFTGKSVAVLKSNQFYLNIFKKYPSITVIESPSELDAIKLTIEGKAEAAVIGTTFYTNYLKTFGKDIKIGYVATDTPLDIVYSIRKDWPELVSIINKALASLPQETKNSMFFHWFGFSLADFGLDKQKRRIPLTDKEKSWIEAHPDIRLGVNPARQPTEFVNENKVHQGIASDYVRALNEHLGLNMKIVPNLSWNQVMAAVPTRGIDVLPSVTKTSEREKHLLYTEPYLFIDWVIISRTDTPTIKDLADLKGRLTSICAGSSGHERIMKQYPEIPLLLEVDTLNVLQNVVDGKTEAAIVELNPASLVIHGYRMYSLKINQHVLQQKDPISFAVRNDWPELVEILNKGLASISAEEHETIEQKWLAMPIQIGFTKMDLLRIVLYVFAVMSTLLVFFLFWNRRLKKEIFEKIKAEKERTIAEEALKEINEKYFKAFQTSPYAIIITKPNNGEIVEVNDAFTTITDYSREEALESSTISLSLWVNEEERQKVVSDLITGRVVTGQEYLFRTKNGQIITGLFSAQRINLKQGPCILSSINDITKQKQAEREKAKLKNQLTQVQKLESIGQLAGGVAHDYNNALSVIIGFTDLVMARLDPSGELYADLGEVMSAAKRSTDITRQLLAFARKQTVSPQVLDVNENLQSTLKMLHRLIGEDIDLAWIPGAEVWQVKIDPSQVDQIMANLCINARDAIDGVGKVTIETKNIIFDQKYCDDHLGFVPGEFVMIAVSDDGVGIAPEIMDRIFEPFFTTKEVGKGTGLGLATVYGITKQNNGFINVYSEHEKGTTIKIYLPRHMGQTVPANDDINLKLPISNGEIVLLVEDETSILKLGERMLKELGYSVLSSTSTTMAIKLAAEHVGEINLLITDVVMPEMNGRELSERLRGQYPNIKTLFMSGYTANVIAHRGVLDEGVNFMPKPFSKQDIAFKVREALVA